MKRILLILTIVITLVHTAFAQETDSIMACDTITDINFQLPDEYVANLERELDDWYIRNYTAYTPKSHTITHSANYPDSIYRKRLNELETTIEMPYNQVVRNCIDRYMRNHNNSLGAILGRSVLYMPIFEQALEEAGLPLELKYLSVVESALRPSATSRVGAAGLWQFMPATGRMYNLHISTLVDERRDPYKSSVAAAQYLKDLYEMFNDWHLALAAYNCGPGRIARAINSTGKKDFWDIYYTLPSETRMYVPLFIAANYAMTYYQEHNVEPILPVKPLTTDTVMIQHKLYLEHIATVMNIPIDALKELNPQYRCDIIPGSDSKPYSLTLPSQQAFVYTLMQDSILAYAKKDLEEKGITEEDISADPTPIYHKVRSGETLSTIARKYSTTVKNIKRWSNIKSDRLRIGQRLIVGWSNGVPPAKSSAKKSSATPSDKASYHKVRKGETLSTIARKYGTTVQKIKKANNIKGDNIQVGQRLAIP